MQADLTDLTLVPHYLELYPARVHWLHKFNIWEKIYIYNIVYLDAFFLIFHNYIAWANTGIAKVVMVYMLLRTDIAKFVLFQIHPKKGERTFSKMQIAYTPVSFSSICLRLLLLTTTSHSFIIITSRGDVTHFAFSRSNFAISSLVNHPFMYFVWSQLICINETPHSHVPQVSSWWDLIRWDNNAFRTRNIANISLVTYSQMLETCNII